jgi:hypothetical protein
MTLDELKRMVSELWPSYHANVYPMWSSKLCHYDVSEIRAALRQQRAADPDGTKPIWALIYTRLSAEVCRAAAAKTIETNRQAEADKARLASDIEAAWSNASQAERDAALQEYNAPLPVQYRLKASEGFGVHEAHVKRRLYERERS